MMLGGRSVNPADHRSGRAPAAQRRRGNGPRLRHAGAAGLSCWTTSRASTPSPPATRPSDAVVAVSRGGMKLLTRDELQGVIGHEFSHILNGDMRLNLRLIGIVFGILCLAVIGARSCCRRAAGSSRDRNPAAAARPGAAAHRLHRRVLRPADPRPPSAASASSWPTPPRCSSRAIRRPRRRAEEDRRPDRRLADRATRTPRGQPHVLRRRRGSRSSISSPRTRRWRRGFGRSSRTLTANFPKSSRWPAHRRNRRRRRG